MYEDQSPVQEDVADVQAKILKGSLLRGWNTTHESMGDREYLRVERAPFEDGQSFDLTLTSRYYDSSLELRMMNGSWSKSGLEARPQHRASEHTRSLTSAGRAINFPEVANVTREVNNCTKWKRSRLSLISEGQLCPTLLVSVAGVTI